MHTFKQDYDVMLYGQEERRWCARRVDTRVVVVVVCDRCRCARARVVSRSHDLRFVYTVEGML